MDYDTVSKGRASFFYKPWITDGMRKSNLDESEKAEGVTLTVRQARRYPYLMPLRMVQCAVKEDT